MKIVADAMFKIQMRSDVDMEDTFEDEVDQGKIIVCVSIRRGRSRRMWVDFLISIMSWNICRYWPGHFLISHNCCLWAEVQTDNV